VFPAVDIARPKAETGQAITSGLRRRTRTPWQALRSSSWATPRWHLPIIIVKSTALSLDGREETIT
jgi:hypothetical protein